MVCHTKLDAEYEPLKPYVCASKLCAYQYYQLNMGPSLEVPPPPLPQSQPPTNILL